MSDQNQSIDKIAEEAWDDIRKATSIGSKTEDFVAIIKSAIEKDRASRPAAASSAEATAAKDAGQAAETMAEQLHVWYLEATQALDPANYNPKAQKSYAELNEQQKEIDRYIARKVLALQHRPNPRQAAEPDPLLVNEGENIDYCSGQKFVSTDWLERLANRFERRANKIYRSTGYCTEEQRQTMTAIFDGIAEEIRAEVNYRPEPRSTEFQPPPTCSKCGYHVEIVDGICLNCGEPFPARSTEAGQAAGEWLEVQWRVTRLQAIVTHGGYEELSQTIVAALRSQQQDTERLVALLDAYSNGDDTRPAVAVLSDIESIVAAMSQARQKGEGA